MRKNAYLVYNEGSPDQQAFPFREQIVVGRRRGRGTDLVARVTIRDPVVSGRHCVIRQAANGQFFIRDESRNGTKVDGRRLVPNLETAFHPGEVIQIGKHGLRLGVEATETIDDEDDFSVVEGTVALTNIETEVTVLVGDIRGYTTMNSQFSASIVYPSVERVFAQLEAVIVAHHGTVKEIQGDAVFAFWELNEDQPDFHIVQACRCAVALRNRVYQLAEDPLVWTIPDHKLQMEWALTTGDVLISNMAGQMAVVGDCVNYAFRLEKLANEDVGIVLAAHTTVERAHRHFRFLNLGVTSVKGRETEEPIYALLGPR